MLTCSKYRRKKHSIDEDDKEQLEENPAFIREIIEVKVPERFSKELKLDPFADTIFGKSYEEAFKARTFKNALAMYATHIQMAKKRLSSWKRFDVFNDSLML